MIVIMQRSLCITVKNVMQKSILVFRMRFAVIYGKHIILTMKNVKMTRCVMIFWNVH